MEHEERREDRRRPRPYGTHDDGDDDLDATRDRLEGMLDEAERTMDAVVPANAEQYLYQQRQRGAE